MLPLAPVRSIHPAKIAPTPGDTTSALPDYVPYEGPRPDFPGDGQDVYAAYSKFPIDPPSCSASKPGTGGTITASRCLMCCRSSPTCHGWLTLLEASFTDLTPYLAGDAVANYPALANLPTRSWRAGVRNGRLFAVPYPQQTTSATIFARSDVFADRDLPLSPSDGECSSISAGS